MVSLGGAPLALPTFSTSVFLVFFKLGRALRVTLPTGNGRVVHLIVIYGDQGAEEDSEKLQLTDRLLQAVLAEAGVVCTGQPVLIAGDLNADPAVIPCLAKGFSAGRFVNLALAYSLGEGKRLDATHRFRLDDCAGSRREFILGCSDALAASTVCKVTDGWFPPHFSVFASFGIDGWLAEVSCPIVSQPLWPACWIDTPDRSSSSVARVVQDVWDVHGDELAVVPPDVVLALGDAVSMFGLSGARVQRLVSSGRIAGLEAPLRLTALLFLEEVRYAFVVGVWEVELWAAVMLADFWVSHSDEVDFRSAQHVVNSSLAPVLLFRGRFNSVADVLKGTRNHGFTQARWEALLGF